ncbi:DUF4238 domain-containing protein [Chryseobacterium aquaticum]|nr:DUF4238 domain-containing protein [Chryseobacterium aquaticum]
MDELTTDKKNQHYIPKFYLKKFSYNLNDKQLGIFNLDTEFFKIDAKLKTQASKSFFYGRDGKLEDALGGLEKIYGETFKKIILSHKLSKNNPNEKRELISFIVVSQLRNPLQISNAQNAFDDLEKTAKNLYPNETLKEPMGKISHEESVKILLGLMSELAKYLHDLDYKLIINDSDLPFIISDNPIVKYNQFLEQVNRKGSTTSYGNIGIQIFIPLNPKLMVIFFDSKIYKLGYKKQQEIKLNNYAEITDLNILQFLNCDKMLFFNEKITKNYILELKTKAEKFEKANIAKTEVFKIFNEYESKFEDIIMRYESECVTNLKLSFIKLHSSKTHRILSNEMIQLRDTAKKIRENRHRS